MNLNQKRKLLQAALDGNDEGLRQLHRERRKQQMPYIEVKGIVDIRQCHAGFLDLLVADTNTYEDRGHWVLEPLRDYLQRYEQLPTTETKAGYDMAIGLIDQQDKRYDELPLSYLVIETRQRKITAAGGTVAQLRHYFNQSQEVLKKGGTLTLLFESSLARLDLYAWAASPKQKQP